MDHPLRVDRRGAALGRHPRARRRLAQKVDKELSKVYLPGEAEQVLLRRIV
jgi:hypothetical protein